MYQNSMALPAGLLTVLEEEDIIDIEETDEEDDSDSDEYSDVPDEEDDDDGLPPEVGEGTSLNSDLPED